MIKVFILPIFVPSSLSLMYLPIRFTNYRMCMSTILNPIIFSSAGFYMSLTYVNAVEVTSLTISVRKQTCRRSVL